MKSVRKFVLEVLKITDKIDVLINNAGIMMIEETITEDGNEKQMQVNHIGHFLLTKLLMPVLEKSAPVRIINVSSLAHTWSEYLKRYSTYFSKVIESASLTFYFNHLTKKLLSQKMSQNIVSVFTQPHNKFRLSDYAQEICIAKIIFGMYRIHFYDFYIFSAKTFDIDDLNLTKSGYGRVKAYANSKLANVLFTKELHRRFKGNMR